MSKWVNTNLQHYQPDEANDGIHAIKISRKRANETDEGEGILSDFIPVIAGTYDFYYDVKLKNISPNKGREGTKLYDAVDVSVYFYDKDKQKMDGYIYYPYKKVLYNNTFKGYTFSNYWHIDNFGWGRVNARTYNYPFSEGDIPEGTSYVRIFLGLKGTGTMWVDNIDYRYSKWSFTALERMQQYFDQPLNAEEQLIPKPKQVSAVTDIDLSGNKSTGVIYINLPLYSTKQDSIAGRLLEKKIEEINSKLQAKGKANKIKVHLLSGPVEIKEKPDLVFSIGKTDFYSQYISRLALAEINGKAQGYVIKSIIGSYPIIILAGNEAIGDYYAATTAVQLFDDKQIYIQGC